ncbi:MAG: DUF1254 domain-containing protein [Alphaproteobacteria bacterium]|nr:DUF1254 domain-containing protein [Rhizobiaceae bacterium]MBU3960027.1 DUF1254 domain-containing protein [Alphaproteobacteria bacterium]MBU4050660.1 DUF1254 domain-containing protein [Alphaproteobacteria bacterium]MBU4089683.1 DUF1254 domain-containing protein [Alphaproteobacteria bacterium]MBU4155381.1 DUF1254 domain-containing protein [Alphaproteobacteria bacterium]
MNRLTYAVLTGLIGAALLHIIIILSLPHFTGRDAFTRVKMTGPSHRFITLPDLSDKQADAGGLANVDPFLKVAVCHFDLTLAPIRLLAPAGPGFWSMAVYDQDSNEVFSMNDRTSVGGDLDALVASPVQVAQIRKAPGAALTQSIIVEHRGTTGYIVLRTMVPAPSFATQAETFLDEAVCAPLSGD